MKRALADRGGVCRCLWELVVGGSLTSTCCFGSNGEVGTAELVEAPSVVGLSSGLKKPANGPLVAVFGVSEGLGKDVVPAVVKMAWLEMPFSGALMDLVHADAAAPAASEISPVSSPAGSELRSMGRSDARASGRVGSSAV